MASLPIRFYLHTDSRDNLKPHVLTEGGIRFQHGPTELCVS